MSNLLCSFSYYPYLCARLSNKVKESEINTEGDVLDITGTLKKNKFILDDKEELQLKRKLKDTKNQVAIAEPSIAVISGLQSGSTLITMLFNVTSLR